METHQLKTWMPYFEEIYRGRKNFETRTNDRNFKVGDILILDEYNQETNKYTGRSCCRKITYILPNNNQFIKLDNNVIIMSLSK